VSGVPSHNRQIVKEALAALFERRDPLAVERYYAADYLHHTPTLPQGRNALTKRVAQLPDTVLYEPGILVSEGEYVAAHGRISGWAVKTQVVMDLFRLRNGLIVEHWDVRQDEAPAAPRNGGLPMFDVGEAQFQRACPDMQHKAEVDYDTLMRINLEDVFGQHDPALRLAAIADLYVPDAVLYEPHGVAQGHAGISAAVTALLESLPSGFRFQARGPAIGHHGVGRLHWQSGPPGGPIAVTGTDVARFDQGRIVALHVFLDPSA